MSPVVPGTGPKGPQEAKFDLETALLAALWTPVPHGDRRRLQNVIVTYRCAGTHPNGPALLGRICRTPRGPLLILEVRGRYSRTEIGQAKSAGRGAVPQPTFPTLDLLSLPAEDAHHEAHELRCRRHGVRAVRTRQAMIDDFGLALDAPRGRSKGGARSILV